MKPKWPPHWIYYASIAYISGKMWSSVLIKAYLWSINDGNASWNGNGCQGPRQVRNRQVAKSLSVLIPIPIILVK